MSKQNLQNLHSTNWLRVVDVVFVFLLLSFAMWITGTLLDSWMGIFSIDGQFSDLFGPFNRVCLETFPFESLIVGGSVEVSEVDVS